MWTILTREFDQILQDSENSSLNFFGIQMTYTKTYITAFFLIAFVIYCTLGKQQKMLNYLFSSCFLICLFLPNLALLHNMIIAAVEVYASTSYSPREYEPLIDHSQIVIFSHITLFLLFKVKTFVSLFAQISVLTIVFYCSNIPEGASFSTLSPLNHYKLFLGYLETLMYYTYTPALLCIYYLYILTLLYLLIHICSLVSSKNPARLTIYLKLAFAKLFSFFICSAFIIISSYVIYVMLLALFYYVVIQIEEGLFNLAFLKWKPSDWNKKF